MINVCIYSNLILKLIQLNLKNDFGILNYKLHILPFKADQCCSIQSEGHQINNNHRKIKKAFRCCIIFITVIFLTVKMFVLLRHTNLNCHFILIRFFMGNFVFCVERCNKLLKLSKHDLKKKYFLSSHFWLKCLLICHILPSRQNKKINFNVINKTG